MWLDNLPRRAALIALAGSLALPVSALASDDAGFLGSIRRHSLVTSTVPANGDQNPYAVVVAPVTSGKLGKVT